MDLKTDSIIESGYGNGMLFFGLTPTVKSLKKSAWLLHIACAKFPPIVRNSNEVAHAQRQRYYPHSRYGISNSFFDQLPTLVGRIVSRLRGGMPWRYDGKASCMSKQTVTLLYWFWRLSLLENAMGVARLVPHGVHYYAGFIFLFL